MDNSKYIKEVMSYIHSNRKIKKKIKEDLSQRIDDSYLDNPYFNPYTNLGTPQEYAGEFMENLEGSGALTQFATIGYEYKSERTLFGLPLVHVNSGSRSGTSIAKGIIAVGDVAIGVISVGGVSIGIFSLGGVSLGLIALGGVAIGGVALGAVTIGFATIGAVSIGILKSIGVITG